MPHPRPTRTLADRPDLDQLKRQAKELLDGVTSGDADALAELERHDPGADRAAFALHGAQLVLARAYGFDSWPKLKAFVEGMNAQRLRDAPQGRRFTSRGDRPLVRVAEQVAEMKLESREERRGQHVIVRG
jgi:hypothetical protein